VAYITPDVEPTDYVFRRLVIPNDTYFLGAVNDALAELEEPKNWESVGGITAEAAAALASTMVERYFDEPMPIGFIGLSSTTDLPAGALYCDGALYNRVDYPQLYAAIKTDYIVDADTFNVPTLADVGVLKYVIFAG